MKSAILVLTCLLATSPCFPAEPADRNVQLAVAMGSGVFSWDALKPLPTEAGWRRQIFDQATKTMEKFECHASTVNPGKTSHPPQSHVQEEFLIVKEGELEVLAGADRRRIGPGSFVFFGSNEPQQVLNVGDKPATYYVFSVVTEMTHRISENAGNGVLKPGMLGSTIIDWNEMKPLPFEAVVRRSLLEKPTRTLGTLEGHITTLNAGATSHAAHRHPDEEIIVMKEGRLDVTINGHTYQAGPGDVCFFACNDEHGVMTVGSQPATYFAIRVRTEKTPKQ